MDRVLQDIRDAARRYPFIHKVVLFGSRARGDNTDDSDYDLAIYADPGGDEAGFLDVLDEMPTLSKLDVVFIKLHHKGTPFYGNILREGVVVLDKFQTKLDNFHKAVERLEEALQETETSESLTMRDGTIQRFEFTTELAWKTAREYLLQQDVLDINSPKAVMREAFHNHLITDEQGWVRILQDRNITSHLYDEKDADDVFYRIRHDHIQLFQALEQILQERKANL